MRIFLLFLTTLFTATVYGQSTNVFLDRSYWKEKPSIEQVKADIKAGNDPAEFDNHKFDAVTWAIIEDVSDDVVWFLLEQEGNDVNKRSHDGRTPIFWAAYRGNLNFIKTLIKKGAKTDLIDSHGYSLVNFSATTGQVDTDLYDLCIKEGTELQNESNNDGATPLLLILPHLKSTDMISYFTSKGLELDHTDKNGNNAFAYAAKSGNQLIMDYLLEQNISPKANNSAAVLFACKGMRRKKNGLETFQYLQEKGLSLNTVDDQKKNALHYLASGCKDASVLDFFLNQGLSLNSIDANGDTPYFKAFQHNSAEIISHLLSKEELKHKVNSKGENIIHLAAKRGNIDILKVAIEVEDGVDVLSEDGLTPLHIAAMKSKDFDLIITLLESGANKEVKTPFEETAFDLAIENQWLTDKKRVKKHLK